jgi:hypothetical protein
MRELQNNLAHILTYLREFELLTSYYFKVQ